MHLLLAEPLALPGAALQTRFWILICTFGHCTVTKNILCHNCSGNAWLVKNVLQFAGLGGFCLVVKFFQVNSSTMLLLVCQYYFAMLIEWRRKR